jgi:universal stress protein E
VKPQQRLLVVVDPTASFHPAIERAAWLARRLPAQIELFICDYDPHLANTQAATAAAIANARAELLTRHRQRLQLLAEPLTTSGLSVSVDARWDYPLHDGVIRKALDVGADLVIKDTHYHSVLKRSIFSNTDWSLIRYCPTQLLLVKPRPPGQKPCFVAAVDPLHERDKPADLDRKIMNTAGALARTLGGEMHVFHAFDITAALAMSTDSMTMPIALPVREFTDAMRAEHTAAVAALCKEHGIPSERSHVHQGGTRELLMTLTEQLRADIVVMGAVSRSGIKGLFLGNTAEDVLDRLHCDLLIVKPDGFKTALAS